MVSFTSQPPHMLIEFHPSLIRLLQRISSSQAFRKYAGAERGLCWLDDSDRRLRLLKHSVNDF
jgi:hypothetical protein